MSMASHHLPSPAPTPNALSNAQNTTNGENDGPVDQVALRAELESQILRLSQDLYELEICAGDVGQGMEDAVPNYLMKINQGFANLSALSAQMTDSVPHQIIDNVDRSKNPHLYTKQAITRATGENQYALGRILGLESFRRQLATALGENFPELPIPERRHKPSSAASQSESGTGGEERQTSINGEITTAIKDEPASAAPEESKPTSVGNA